MGKKFRLGPMIDVFQSQRLEDQPRKSYPTRSRQAENLKTKQRKVSEKTYPSKDNGGKSTQTIEMDGEADSDQPATRARPPTKSVKALPYVDVPPLKPALPPVTLTAPVSANDRSKRMMSVTTQPGSDVISNDKELPKVDHAYKSQAPVEAGLDIASLIRY